MTQQRSTNDAVEITEGPGVGGIVLGPGHPLAFHPRLLCSGLSPAAINAYLVLLHMTQEASQQWDHRRSPISAQVVADRMTVGRSTARVALAELKRAGWVRYQIVAKKSGNRLPLYSYVLSAHERASVTTT